jgi:HD-GYP domain-containing protein (c-di-GMP phosphodiesterase class II)
VKASPERKAEAVDAATLLTANRRYQISVGDLQLGMFIAELDRPWLDTPFLLQGFLADSQVELDTLRKFCSYVYVDLELSAPEVADTIRRAEVRDDTAAPAHAAPAHSPSFRQALAAAPTEETEGTPASATARPNARIERRHAASNRAYKTRSDVKISTDTRQRFRALVRATSSSAPVAATESASTGVIGRAVGWFKARIGPEPKRRRIDVAQHDQASRDAIKPQLPPDIELTRYTEVRPVEQEMPRARSSFTHSEDVLKAVVADVKVGKIPQVAEVASAVDDMVASMIDNPDALLWVSRLREEDVNTYNHGVKVALYLIALGRQLGFPKKELANLGMIGMLADVGKIKLPRALLDKPGMLAPSEYSLIKEHVRLGLDALREAGTLPPEVELGIAQHHERLDGSGYPKGLKGNDISVYGRMAAISDSFAALITPRAYANPLPAQDALMNLYEWAGTSFHEPLVEQFVQAVGVFPVGSLVELSSGEVAIVVAHNRVRRLEPRVLVLTWPDKSPLSTPTECDLLMQGKASGAERLRIIRGLASGAYGLKLRDYYMTEVAKANGLPN